MSWYSMEQRRHTAVVVPTAIHGGRRLLLRSSEHFSPSDFAEVLQTSAVQIAALTVTLIYCPRAETAPRCS